MAPKEIYQEWQQEMRGCLIGVLFKNLVGGKRKLESQISVIAISVLLVIGIVIAADYDRTVLSLNVNKIENGTGMIVPAYSDPNGSWNELLSIHKLFPKVPIIVIINPDNGSGNYSSNNYANWTDLLKLNGIKVLGYVYTSYGNRSESTIEQQVLNYASWYKVDGIFLDEVGDNSSNTQFYRSVVKNIRGSGLDYVVGNPGTNSPKSISSLFNLTIQYENSGLPPEKYFESIVNGTPRSNSSVICYSVARFDSNWATAAEKYFSFIYITNLGLPNPYEGFPPYLTEEAQLLSYG